ncbi:hypothetical protein A9G12_00600 [Gilliamella sp. wkB112]|nr:hypothetical protein A9G12_00600 [Gilliamella apicola]
MNIKIKTLASWLVLIIITMPHLLQAAVKPEKRLNIIRPEIQLNQKPDWLTIVSSNYYDGDKDDLVTAGLGFTRLSTTNSVTNFANPAKPTIHELRQAKLNRFINPNTGEGSLFGFKRQDLTPLFDGKVAGTEILATIDNDNEKVGLLLQIPLDFDTNKPCIVAVPASDSDGLFNAKDIQIRGLWGLRHNCAVVYNDKALGNGIYDITNQRGYSIDGITQTNNLMFAPKINNRAQYSQQYPNRYAIKQLHSKQNSEQRWGEFVLKSIEFAFYQLNSEFSETQKVTFNKDNTIVLVYGTTDGGGAALKAGELDKDNIIKGIVAVNPQIYTLPPKTPITLKLGDNATKPLDFKSIADYSSYAALYIPCAVPAIIANHSDNYIIPLADRYLHSQNRCDSLNKAKLLTTASPQEALDKLHQYGWTSDMDIQLPYFYYRESIGLPYKYISSYGRFDVSQNMCNYSVASTQQDPIYYMGLVKSLKEVTFEQLWGLASGNLPLWLGINATALDLVNNDDLHSPRRDFYSSSQHKDEVDYNTKGAICLNKKLKDPRVQQGLKQVAMSGNLNKIKTFIVHARNNVKQLPDTARAYVALNSQIENKTSQLRYMEVENTSYLDGEVPFDNTLVSIDYYGEDAIEWLWANLTSKATLPDSQVIRAKAQGGKSGYTTGVTSKNLIPISQSPNRNDLIKKENGKITLPK